MLVFPPAVSDLSSVVSRLAYRFIIVSSRFNSTLATTVQAAS